MNNTKKKIIVAICVIIVSIVLGTVLFLTILTNKSQDYITEKYGVDEEQIELVKFNLPDYWVSDNPLPNIQTDHLNWIYKYKDNEFTVKYYDSNFCDDFQLEEVQKLCTEYFRENISENIIGFEVSCYDLYDYQHYLYEKDYTLTNTVITNENVIIFIGDEWNCYEERWIYVEPIGNFEAEEKEEKRIRGILAKTIPNYEDYDYGVLFGFVEENY